ncbi:MAG: DUF4226 domain-containing protein [Mycobacteriaceae bacterium]
MSQYGDSPDALESAQRALAARDADLAAADRELADAVAGAHALAVESLGRIDAVSAELDAVAADAPRDSPGAAHELTRHLVVKNRDIAAIVTDAKTAAHAKAVALKELTSRYR